ncbi:MAG: GerMN domain-containing protein [Ilumatobacteraceae bacterium]
MFVYLDVNDALYSLSGSTLVDALAQIVFTMVELPEVSRVQLLVDGEPQEWPTGDGSLSRRAS